MSEMASMKNNRVILNPLEEPRDSSSMPQTSELESKDESDSVEINAGKQDYYLFPKEVPAWNKLEPLAHSPERFEENRLFIVEVKKRGDGLGFNVQQSGEKVRVSKVFDNGKEPVIKHGLCPADSVFMESDIIVSVGTESIENVAQFENAIYAVPVGRFVLIHVFREGTLTLLEEAQKRDDAERQRQENLRQQKEQEELDRLREQAMKMERKALIRKIAHGSDLLTTFNSECEKHLTVPSLELMHILRSAFCAKKDVDSYCLGLGGLEHLNSMHLYILFLVLAKKKDSVLKGKSIKVDFGWRELDRLAIYALAHLIADSKYDGSVSFKAETVNTGLPVTLNKPFLFGIKFLTMVAPSLPLLEGLENIRLVHSNLQDGSSHLLLRDVAKCEHLQTLDLNHNNLSKRLAIGLGQLFCNPESNIATKLKCLCLSWNELGNPGAIALFTALYEAGESVVLQELDLAFNGLGNEATQSIRKVLEANTLKCLNKLNLSHNRIQHDGGVELAQALENNTTLYEFQIGFNKLGFDATVQLISKVKRSTNMLALHVENTVGDYLETGTTGSRVEYEQKSFQKYGDDAIQYLWDLKEHMNVIRCNDSKDQIDVLIEFPFKVRECTSSLKWFYVPLEIQDDASHAKPVVDKTNLAASCFKDRCKESDSRTFFDTLHVIHTSMENDWQFLFPKVQRFLKDSEQWEPLKDLIATHYFRLTNIFRFYAAEGDEHDCIGFNEFIDLVSECKIPDQYSCPDNAAQGAFIAANVELQAETKAEKDAADNNPDNAMCQYEFIEAMIRLALKKFFEKTSFRKAATQVEAVEWLLKEHVFPHCEVLDSNKFRRDKMYYFDVVTCLETYKVKLDRIWRDYAGSSGVNLLMKIDEWKEMLSATGFAKWSFTVGMKKGEVPKNIVEAPRQKFAFWAAQTMIKNILTRNVREKSRNTHDALTYTEFLEAICRLADSITDPATLEYLGLPDDAYLSEKLVCVIEGLLGEQNPDVFDNAKYPAIIATLREKHIPMKYKPREDYRFEDEPSEEEKLEEQQPPNKEGMP